MQDKLIKKIILMVGIIAVLGVASSSVVLSSPASAQKGLGEEQVIGVFGKIPGKDLIVHILIVVPPGVDKSGTVSEALRQQGAVPWVHDEFSTTGLVWDQFSDNDSGNDFVTQYYNSNNDPTGNGGLTALSNTYGSWNGVTTSIFEFSDGGSTDRCPSLVRECQGPQYYDGFNDVAWLQLSGCCTLGVTWFSTSIDEADMALNTKFSWATNGNNYDVQTVFLHENGHVVGLGHSEELLAVMYPSYQGVRQNLHQDDKDGITSLYPIVNSVPTVSITSPADGSNFDSGATILFEGTASDTEDGDLTTSLVWTSDIDGQIGTGGSFSKILTDGDHVITASVTDGDGATGTKSVSITVGPVNSVPTVSITSPADGSNFDSGATILFEGTASDTEDGDLTTSLVWTSDIDGQIGTGGSFQTTLSDGTHTITAEVTDSGGLSESASVSITVGDPPTTPTAVSVDSIMYATHGGRDDSKHLDIIITLVDDLGDPVSGASVSIDLFRDDSFVASGSGTTGTGGTITFTLNNAASGCYTTTVTSVDAGLTWDNTTPANEFCK